MHDGLYWTFVGHASFSTINDRKQRLYRLRDIETKILKNLYLIENLFMNEK